MKELILTVGLPRSGKTTWARRQGVPIVNPDSIRLALHGQRYQPLAEGFVWATAKVMVRALFLAGHHRVILDATNVTKARRDEWKSAEWVTAYKVITTSYAECYQRAAFANDTEIMPVIDRMHAQYELIEIEPDAIVVEGDLPECDSTIGRQPFEGRLIEIDSDEVWLDEADVNE